MFRKYIIQYDYSLQSEVWLKDIQFLAFVPHSECTNTDEWVSAAEIIADDLICLLSLPCHVFWSQIMFDESLLLSLDSYLNFAPRLLDLLYC